MLLLEIIDTMMTYNNWKIKYRESIETILNEIYYLLKNIDGFTIFGMCVPFACIGRFFRFYNHISFFLPPLGLVWCVAVV